MPVVNTDEFCYDEEEVKKFDWEDFAKDEFWNSCDDMGELEDKYDITFHKVQPQLTIPKSIADEIDKFGLPPHSLGMMRKEFSTELKEYYFPHYYLIMAYLAGKALGVDLVKVVEG